MKRNEVILGWVDVLVFGFEGLGDVWDLALMDLVCFYSDFEDK